MITRCFVAAIGCLMVAGCSGPSGLTTGSLIGTDTKKVAAPAAPVVKNDPITRAFHVGANTARAVRCGFHFDAAKLKGDFMAKEAAGGLPVEVLTNTGKAYSTGFNGVAKAIEDAGAYCTAKRVATVKAELTRHLGGDYSPPVLKQVAAKPSGGIFGGLFSGDDLDEGPKYGSQEWWDKQNAEAGN